MEKQTCENCKYFVRYYIMRKDKFLPTYNGFCIQHTNRKIDSCCEKWQEGKYSKEDALKTADHIIRDIHKRLEDIYKILKYFEDED